MLRLLALFLAVFLIAPVIAAEPAQTVDRFHAGLLDNMKRGKTLGCAGRIAHMKPVIQSTFDLPFLSQRILRKRWAELSEAQRARFTTALQDMVVATYAGQFASFGGESFTTLATETNGSNRVVHSKFKHGAETVSFDYVLRQTAGEWRVVNVVAEGVSDLAIRSAQYESVFKQKGFEGLITHMQAQTAKNKTGC